MDVTENGTIPLVDKFLQGRIIYAGSTEHHLDIPNRCLVHEI